MNKVLPYLKAVVGFVTPGVVILGGAITDASDGGSCITGAEWITAMLACLGTGALVYRVPNKDPKATHQEESVMPPRRGKTTYRHKGV